MKKCLFGLIGVALLGGNPLLGQTPTPYPGGLGGAPAGTPALLAGPHGATCAPTKPACVPEHYVKKTIKVVYTSGSEPLCLPYCAGLFAHFGCDSGHCGHPHTRRYLIKKIQTVEEDAIKCVPTEVPACQPAHHCHP
jgi:hypothetical protein